MMTLLNLCAVPCFCLIVSLCVQIKALSPLDGPRPIYIRLKDELTSARSRSQFDPQAMQAYSDLTSLAPMQPVINPSRAASRSFRDVEALRAHRLTLYHVIEPNSSQNVTKLLDDLMKNPLVDEAYVEPEAQLAGFLSVQAPIPQLFEAPPTIPDYTDCNRSLSQCQKYMMGPEALDTYKFGGINAFEAQRLSNNLGGLSRVMMVESDMWAVDHIDLKHDPFMTIGVPNLTDSYPRTHCTMSAGTIFGRDNGFGVKGIVPDAQPGFAKYSAQRLVDLADVLERGDVVQVGIHYSVPGDYCTADKNCFVPVEYNSLAHDAIKYLTEERGIHVIIAGANGNIDLDHKDFKDTFSRARDSGAIYAAAGDPTLGKRAGFSDFGERMDLWAWGVRVTTTTWKKAGENDQFTTSYSGTSASNPIIAGCAAFVQSVARARGLGNLPPKILRQILVDSGSFVPIFEEDKFIGVQPDLVKALELIEQMVTTSTSTTTTATTTSSSSTTRPTPPTTTIKTTSTSSTRRTPPIQPPGEMTTSTEMIEATIPLTTTTTIKTTSTSSTRRTPPIQPPGEMTTSTEMIVEDTIPLTTTTTIKTTSTSSTRRTPPIQPPGEMTTSTEMIEDTIPLTTTTTIKTTSTSSTRRTPPIQPPGEMTTSTEMIIEDTVPLTTTTTIKTTSSSSSSASLGGICDGVPEWNADHPYGNVGEAVVFNHVLYQSNHWTVGEQPDRFNGLNQSWRAVLDCTTTTTTTSTTSDVTTTSVADPPPTDEPCAGIPQWEATKVYAVQSETVVYDDKLYESNYWTLGQSPKLYNGQGQPWTMIEDCNGKDFADQSSCAPQWDNVKRYIVYGERVEFEGKMYTVNFESIHQQPDQHSAPWGQPWIPAGNCESIIS